MFFFPLQRPEPMHTVDLHSTSLWLGYYPWSEKCFPYGTVCFHPILPLLRNQHSNPNLISFSHITRQDKTRQEKTSGRPKSKATRRLLLQCFYHNLQHLPQLMARVGTTRIPLNTHLIPRSTGTHFTHHEWMETWVNFWSVRQWLSLDGHPSSN